MSSLSPPLLQKISLSKPCGQIPTDHQCHTWWETYGMLDNIKRHSQLVAEVATEITRLALARHPGFHDLDNDQDFLQTVRASALLHDLGKTHTITHGGSHSQHGASLTMQLTENPRIAQGVMHHVFWPGPLEARTFFLPLVIVYSDKRVRHDQLVSLEERFSDLFCRYGKTENSQKHIARSQAQCLEMEQILGAFAGEDLHAYCTHCRRLVL